MSLASRCRAFAATIIAFGALATVAACSRPTAEPSPQAFPPGPHVTASPGAVDDSYPRPPMPTRALPEGYPGPDEDGADGDAIDAGDTMTDTESTEDEAGDNAASGG